MIRAGCFLLSKEWIAVDRAADIFTQLNYVPHVMGTNGARRFTGWSSVHNFSVCDAWLKNCNAGTHAHITGGSTRYDFRSLHRVLGSLSNFNDRFQQSGNTLRAGIDCFISVSSLTTLEFWGKKQNESRGRGRGWKTRLQYTHIIFQRVVE